MSWDDRSVDQYVGGIITGLREVETAHGQCRAGPGSAGPRRQSGPDDVNSALRHCMREID